MSMPPGPDPNDGLNELRKKDIGGMERFQGNAGLIVQEIDLDAGQGARLQTILSELISGEADPGDNDTLNELLDLVAKPLSVERRSGQANAGLTLEGQRVLYAANILAFDVWDHDGHHSSAILTDLVEMWTLREAGDMSKGRRRRWEMAKLLWIALRQRADGMSFTIEEIGKLPYDSHRRVAASPRLSQVLIEMGISAVNENPDHLNSDWFGEPRYHWWSTNDSVGAELEFNVLWGLFDLLTGSLGIKNALQIESLHCPFDADEDWSNSLIITYDGSRPADGFDGIALNWRGSNRTLKIEPPEIVRDPLLTVMRIVTPIPTRTDIIGPAPVF